MRLWQAINLKPGNPKELQPSNPHTIPNPGTRNPATCQQATPSGCGKLSSTCATMVSSFPKKRQSPSQTPNPKPQTQIPDPKILKSRNATGRAWCGVLLRTSDSLRILYQPPTLNPQLSTLNPQPSTLNAGRRSDAVDILHQEEVEEGRRGQGGVVGRADVRCPPENHHHRGLIHIHSHILETPNPESLPLPLQRHSHTLETPNPDIRNLQRQRQHQSVVTIELTSLPLNLQRQHQSVVTIELTSIGTLESYFSCAWAVCVRACARWCMRACRLM